MSDLEGGKFFYQDRAVTYGAENWDSIFKIDYSLTI